MMFHPNKCKAMSFDRSKKCNSTFLHQPHKKKDISIIEKIQHRAKKLVPELRNINHNDILR